MNATGIEIAVSMGDVASGLIIFSIGLGVSDWTRRWFAISRKKAIALYIWHSLFCLVYFVNSLGGVADSKLYFAKACYGDVAFSLGTRAVEFITYILVQGLHMSYLGTFLTFNIIGSIGLFAFDGSLRSFAVNSASNVRWIAGIMAFLPSASFWSSAVGKDAIAFFSVNLALWASIELRRRKLLMFTAVICMFVVRPHIAALLVTALAMSLVLASGQLSGFQRIFLIMLSIPAVLALGPIAMNYVGLREGFELDSVMEEIGKRQGFEQRGGSSIDLSSMSLPLLLFTYFFRPLPFEAHNLFALLASMENLILMFLIIFSVKGLKNKRAIGPNYGFMLLYVLFATLTLAPLTGNLGIAARQKWMICPVIIYLLLSKVAASKDRRLEGGLEHKYRMDISYVPNSFKKLRKSLNTPKR